jgi:hypothetical protein
LRVRRLENKEDWKNYKRLYHEAFPSIERKPARMIRKLEKKGCTDIWVMEDQNKFVGLGSTLAADDIVILDYFAVCANSRSHGYGSKGIRKFQDLYQDRRFILEIERTDVQAENLQERLRRKDFYLRNGMSELGVKVDLFGADLELLGSGCQVSFTEYKNVLAQTLGEKAAERVQLLA